MIKFLFFFISFLCLMNFSFAASFTDDQKQVLSYENLYTNGGAETGLTGWSETGGGTLALESTIKRLPGKRSIKFTFSASTDTLNFPSVTVKEGTNNCESTFYYRSTSTALVAEVYYNTDRIASKPLSANTGFTKETVTFTCPVIASSYITKITGGANTEVVYVDDGWIGENRNTGSVNLEPKQYDLTTACSGSSCISSSQSCTTVYAYGVPYKDRSGNWRLKYNMAGNSCTSGTLLSMTISGVVTKSSGWSWAQSCSTDNTSNAVLRQNFSQSGGTASCLFTSNETKITVSGDVALESMPTWATDFEASQVIRSEVAVGLWNGYHGSDCGAFSFTSGTVGDSTADATCTFSEIQNKGMGTVTSALSGSDKLPGIVYTPPSVGDYEVCAHWSQRVPASTTGQIYITDGTLSFGGAYLQTQTDIPNNICGTFPSTSLSAKTVKLNGRTDNGAITLTAAPIQTITWSIKKVSQVFPMPQIVNSVGTSYSGQTVLNSAYITFPAGVPTISSQSGSWISSITDGGTGNAKLNVTSGTWSASPNCTCSGGLTGAGSSAAFCNIYMPTTTKDLVDVYLNTVNDPTVSKDEPFTILCQGIK